MIDSLYENMIKEPFDPTITAFDAGLAKEGYSWARANRSNIVTDSGFIPSSYKSSNGCGYVWSIPDKYKGMSVENTCSFLRGVFDSCGNVGIFGNKEKGIPSDFVGVDNYGSCEDLRILLEYVGIKCYYTSYGLLNIKDSCVTCFEKLIGFTDLTQKGLLNKTTKLIEATKPLRLLYVTGEFLDEPDYAATSFEQNFTVKELVDQLEVNADLKLFESADYCFEAALWEYKNVDPDFIEFIKDNFLNEDTTNCKNFYIVD